MTRSKQRERQSTEAALSAGGDGATPILLFRIAIPERQKKSWQTAFAPPPSSPLHHCAMGYAATAGVVGGGRPGAARYVVTVADDAIEGAPEGSLRWAVANLGGEPGGGPGERQGLYVTFNRSMTIRLKSRLFLASHTTIDGRGVRVRLLGNGLVLQNVTNVIIHNIELGNQPGDHDVLPIRSSQVVWIDHCHVYNGHRGTVDVVYNSTDVTISNCHIHNHRLTMLLGADDSHEYDRNMRVTVYRNWFEKSGQRQPHCRWGQCHVANNLYTDWAFYCLGGRVFAKIRSEANVFRAGRARKEVTPWFGEASLTTPGFDNTPTILSYGDLLLNGATFHQFQGKEPMFDPPYRLPLYDASDLMETFLRQSAGPHRTILFLPLVAVQLASPLFQEPPPHIRAKPNPADMLDWHFVLEGSPGTPYEGGWYHGRLRFPADYPFKPPSIMMLTPNGRFATSTRICMSMSDFHPETWNPMWSVASILTGLLSFMSDDAVTAGSIVASEADRRKLARLSMPNNCRSPVFRKLFPDLVDSYTASLASAAEAAEGADSASRAQGDGAEGRGKGAGKGRRVVEAAAAVVGSREGKGSEGGRELRVGGQGGAERKEGGVRRVVRTGGKTGVAGAFGAGKTAEAGAAGSSSASGKQQPGLSSLSFWVTAAVVLLCGCVMAVPFLDSLSSSLLRLS
ncbi:unnamed protein product [Closterium sp. NIES-65]|nr:unnamed protein product [Closterium sp. NIES-65]